MPAVSEAQRRYLYAHFGEGWVKAHHFDNAGKLPMYKGKDDGKRRSKRHKSKRHKRLYSSEN